MRIHDDFIRTFKELETELGCSIRIHEETVAEETDAKKLQVCRILRNYIQHEADYENFIAISPGMQKYLSDYLMNIRRKKGIVKDFSETLTKYGSLSDQNTLFDAASLLKHKNKHVLPVIQLDKTNTYHIHLISKAFVSDCFADGITKNTKLAKLLSSIPEADVQYVMSDTPTSDIRRQGDIVLVTNTKGKIIGVYTGK